MESPLPGLDNREFALVAWGVLLVGFLFVARSLRPPLLALLGTALHWKVLLLFLLPVTAYVGLIVLLLAQFDLWTKGLISETTYWFLFVSLPLMFRSVDAAKDEEFFRTAFLSSIALTVIVEFFVNLRPMALGLEFVLVPVVVVLAASTAVAEGRTEYRQVRGCLEVGAAIVVVLLLAYTIVGLVTQPEEFFTQENALEFLLPFFLTVAFLPFLYGVALLATYGSLFRHLNWKLAENPDTRRYAKTRAIRTAHIRLRRVHRLSERLHWQLAPLARPDDVDIVLRRIYEAEERVEDDE